jgi:hypothetical protein
MPAAAPTTAATTPLTFPLAMLDGTGRVYTSFQLGATPVRPGAPVYRTVTKTNISSWTF